MTEHTITHALTPSAHDTLTVTLDGRQYLPEDRDYRVTATVTIRSFSEGWEYVDNSLRSGCGAEVSERTLHRMVGAACSFLTAAAEEFANRADRPTLGDAPMFPDHVAEWAHQFADELTMLGMESDERADELPLGDLT